MIKILAVLIAGALVGCGHESRLSSDTEICEDFPSLPQGDALLFGEMHGSVEAPKLISELACALSTTEKVAIGLEVPSNGQELINSYLVSAGTIEDRELLLAPYFWQKGRDGRSSEAMLQLIEDIRLLRSRGKPIELFSFDDQPGTDLERNDAIANGLRRFHEAHPGTKIVALMGNVHAMQTEMKTGEGVLRPSGLLLSDLNPVSILITYPTGTIWACMPDCGVHELSPRSTPSGPAGFKEGATLNGYSHSYLLRRISASPPAVPSGA